MTYNYIYLLSPMQFQRVLILAKSVCYLRHVHRDVFPQLRRNAFTQSLIFGTSVKICQGIPQENKCRAIYMKPQVRFVVGDIKLP